jgi:hypothetical protein
LVSAVGWLELISCVVVLETFIPGWEGIDEEKFSVNNNRIVRIGRRRRWSR